MACGAGADLGRGLGINGTGDRALDVLVGILYREELAKAKDPVAERKRLVAEYNDKFASPWVAAELGYLDDVIDPLDTRPRLIAALEMLRNKRQNLPTKKHGNPPL